MAGAFMSIEYDSAHIRFVPEFSYVHEVCEASGWDLRAHCQRHSNAALTKGVDYADRVRLTLHERSNSVLLHGEMTLCS